jgi:hypothetical protein
MHPSVPTNTKKAKEKERTKGRQSPSRAPSISRKGASPKHQMESHYVLRSTKVFVVSEDQDPDANVDITSATNKGATSQSRIMNAVTPLSDKSPTAGRLQHHHPSLRRV